MGEGPAHQCGNHCEAQRQLSSGCASSWFLLVKTHERSVDRFAKLCPEPHLPDDVRLAQFAEQRLRLDEVGGVEALGEPVVNVGEHRARLVAAIGIAQQARQAGGRA